MVILVLEALQLMHDNKFLTLPVCEDDGTVVGIVDVSVSFFLSCKIAQLLLAVFFFRLCHFKLRDGCDLKYMLTF